MIKIPTDGTAIIECSAHVTRRDKLFCVHFTESKNALKWRAAVHIGDRMEWQWCRTKKQAEDWCLSRLPKTFKPKTLNPL